MRKFTFYLKPHKPSRTTEFDAREVPNRARTHIPRPPSGELWILYSFIWTNVHTEKKIHKMKCQFTLCRISRLHWWVYIFRRAQRSYWNERVAQYFITRFLRISSREFYAHAESKTSLRSHRTCISHTVIQNSLHFTISVALIAHTDTKKLRIILSRGSLHTPSFNFCCAPIAYEYYILWIFTCV